MSAITANVHDYLRTTSHQRPRSDGSSSLARMQTCTGPPDCNIRRIRPRARQEQSKVSGTNSGAGNIMTSRILSFALAAALCIGLFAFAFVAAPHACEWGLSAYFWSGVAVVIALLALPIVLHREQAWLKRGLFSVGLGTLGSMVWVVGLFAANVRIICRLF